jgi:hypothetical protein
MCGIAAPLPLSTLALPNLDLQGRGEDARSVFLLKFRMEKDGHAFEDWY